MNKKKNIGIFIDWFLPAYKAGGPIRSVYNLVNRLGEYYNFYIITSDRDINSRQALKGITVNRWIKKCCYQIIYLSPQHQSLKTINQLVKERKIDLFYLNSMYSIPFTLYPLLIAKKGKKVFLAPRGMLGKGAIDKKKYKKLVYIYTTKLTGIYKNIYWHATSEAEKQAIIKYFNPKNKIYTAANLLSINRIYIYKKDINPIKLIFFSRINKIKKLDFAIKILKRVESSKQIIFDIAGPIEDKGYWYKCQDLIKQLPKNILVRHIGVINFNEVYKTLSKYHFLFLPTEHENFGHSIYESLASGTPVIISNRTPWQNLEQKNIGWDIPLEDTKKFISVIEQINKIDLTQYNKMSEKAYKFAYNYAKEQPDILIYKQMFSK